MIFLSDRAARLYFETTYKYRCIPLDKNGQPFERNDHMATDAHRMNRFTAMENWCTEQFGPCLNQRHHSDSICIETGRHISQIEIDETCRWSAGHTYFCFRHPDDQFAFKMRWPCKTWVHQHGDPT
ncbi:MAG: hypothetical protein EOP84_02700 [Verrucomicrobiaceae bacterium]|nr:MAG: hypothetical protein EOP84_02700 [Verrucomicrobiaceae bacterium]